jgi:hypothetical protein
MGKVKPWQIVVMSLALVALGASAYFSFGSSPSLPTLIDTITMVDVTSGQLYNFSLGGKRGVSIPETNPDTGKRTLVPVDKDETGSWVVGPRDRQVLGQFSSESKLVVDKATGKVQAAPGDPKHVR